MTKITLKHLNKNFINKAVRSKTPAVASIPELAVVLIILGLLVTSFGAFSKIIGIAKANSIISSLTTIKEASFSFKNTYQLLPGDIVNASSVLDSSQQNGNGDGFVTWGQGTGSTIGNESLGFFQHLRNSGYISGVNTMTVTATTDASLTTGSVVRSNIDGSGFIPLSFGTLSMPVYATDSTGQTNTFTIVFGNLSATGNSISSTTPMAGASITKASGKNFDTGAADSSTLLSVDKKIDDNNPAAGNFKFDSVQALPIAGFFVNIN